MRCPFCAFLEDKVIDSRVIRNGRVIRRRRQCEGCDRRFTTYETIEDGTPVIVKKDGRREAYDRQKLIGGLIRACEKRPVATDRIERFADALEARLFDRTTREVSSREVGEAVMEFLRDADPIAYIRFASVYRSFSDLSDFLTEIQDAFRKDGG